MIFNLIVLSALLAFSPVQPALAEARPEIGAEPLSVVSIDALIASKARLYGLKGDLVARIIFCESGGRIDATHTNTNGSVDRGLLQINSIHEVGDLDLLNPEDNLDFGLKMMSKQGTEPWKYSKHCWG